MPTDFRTAETNVFTWPAFCAADRDGAIFHVLDLCVAAGYVPGLTRSDYEARQAEDGRKVQQLEAAEEEAIIDAQAAGVAIGRRREVVEEQRRQAEVAQRRTAREEQRMKRENAIDTAHRSRRFDDADVVLEHRRRVAAEQQR